MRKRSKVFRDKPDAALGSHPMAIIEARKIDRLGVATQGAFAAKIEVDVEVTHGQLAQRAIDRLAITAATEIRFCHCAPTTANVENREHVIRIIHCFEVPEQRRKSQNT